MTPENFAFWMQGYVELVDQKPTVEQWQSIKENLALVFTKVTSPLLVDETNAKLCQTTDTPELSKEPKKLVDEATRLETSLASQPVWLTAPLHGSFVGEVC